MQPQVLSPLLSEPTAPIILIVDDDRVARLSLSNALEQTGYRIAETISGEQCLQIFSSLQPALVLVDAVMPGIDGFTCCEQLQQMPGAKKTPILLITALDDRDSIDRAFAAGVTDYVTKPINVAILQQRVRRLIRESQFYQHLEQMNQQLSRLASQDGLTQIANRRSFDDHLARMWRLMQREQQWLSLLMCDVDFFKPYNDTYGHLQGDACLQDIAQALSQQVCRPLDIVTRYGGEEFAILLPSTSIKGATYVAERLQTAVQDLQIPHQASAIRPVVTISIGLASIQPSARFEPDVLVIEADKALYRAKEQGRDRIVSQVIEATSPLEHQD
ncbi:diguanylate cyclase [Synechococcales cyanobacterium C]|uniref:Diguanylate cyclase n=1 Tax=Petrachloros mirabilis ULC683 TaxID=2781853 RepID=A0A8K2A196_9CYAN|nr:PleD family two-component system response regulator [Petrachloros mirabilis]NCJ07962.1 diguanylate cyclase [Petrachloros mirabilis ULC683]